MRNVRKDLEAQIDLLEKNVAWKWEIERLRSEVATFKNVLIEAGILIDVKGKVQQTVIVVDGNLYSIRKVK